MSNADLAYQSWNPAPEHEDWGMTKVAGSIVLVTGANGGLGTALVRQALTRGAARVYATARHPGAWEDPRVIALDLDVSSEKSVAHMAEKAQDTTILINNAGINSPKPLLTSSLQDVRSIFDVNVFGPLSLIQHFAPILASHGGGAVIDIHSARSWLAGTGAYSASKAAFWALTNSVRLELASQNTQVLGAHFAFADTPMTASFSGVDKSDPMDIAIRIYDGLEAGEIEVVADEMTRRYKAELSSPLTDQYPQFK